MREINIIIYSYLYEYGGGRESWLDYFLNALLLKKYKINVYCLKPVDEKNSMIYYEKFKDVRFYCSEYSKGVNNILNYLRTIRKSLIYDNDSIYLFLGSVVEGLALLDFKSRHHNAITYCWVRSIVAKEISSRHSRLVSFLPKYIEKLVMNKVSYVITNGFDTLDYYQEKYKLIDKIYAIPNAVDIKKYKYAIPYVNSEEIKFSFIGRFTKIKGIYDIIEAFKTLKKSKEHFKHKNYICDFYGEGDNLLKNNLPITIRINRPIMRNEVPLVNSLSNFSFFLGKNSDSGGGGLSHSLLEAMASGQICICYDIPAYSQIVKNGVNGILVNYNDIDDLVLKIKDILNCNDLKRYHVLQEEARETALAFSCENHIKRFIDLIGR